MALTSEREQIYIWPFNQVMVTNTHGLLKTPQAAPNAVSSEWSTDSTKISQSLCTVRWLSSQPIRNLFGTEIIHQSEGNKW